MYCTILYKCYKGNRLLGRTRSRQGFYGYGNETTDSVNAWGFLVKLCDYKVGAERITFLKDSCFSAALQWKLCFKCGSLSSYIPSADTHWYVFALLESEECTMILTLLMQQKRILLCKSHCLKNMLTQMLWWPLVFSRSWFQISTHKPTILEEISCDFPQPPTEINLK